jgi:hypothetical protein
MSPQRAIAIGTALRAERDFGSANRAATRSLPTDINRLDKTKRRQPHHPQVSASNIPTKHLISIR